MLICAFAATITLVLLRQSLVSTAGAQRSVDYAAVTTDLATLRATTEGILSATPYAFLSTVLPGEPDRVCATTTPSTTVAADEPWDCGTSWEYATPLPTTGTWLEIQPPTAQRPTLRVSYHSATPPATETVFYLPHQAGVFTAQSTSAGLNLSTFGPDATLTGGIFAADTLTVPGALTPSDSVTLASEDQVFGDPGDAYVYTPSTSPPLSRLLSAPGDAVVGETIDALQVLGCPGYDPVLVDEAPSHLCLDPGSDILLTTGSLATLPADTHSVLLRTHPSSGLLEVRYRSAAPNITVNSTDPVPDVLSDANARVAAGTYGGVADAWTSLGTVAVPDSGLIASSVDTWVGLCNATSPSNGFMQPATGTCTTTFLPEGTTVVAGNQAEPRDIWLAGPVDGARVAVLAAGDVVLPWFSNTVTSRVAADETVNNVSIASAGELTSFPTTAISTANSTELTGLVIAPHVSFDWDPWTADSQFNLADGLAANPPTWFPGTSLRWTAVHTEVS